MTQIIDSSRQTYVLSDANLDPGNFIPPDQMMDLCPTFSYYAGAEDEDEIKDSLLFSRLEAGELTKFRAIIKKFKDKGMAAITHEQRNLVKKMFRNCMINCDDALAKCERMTDELTDARSDFLRFVAQTNSQISTMDGGLDYKHRIFTTPVHKNAA
jgi:hypothetical protein